MDIFSASEVLDAIKLEFPYAFGDNKYPGAPQINLHIIGDKPIFVDGIEVIPIKAWHGKMPVLGFRIAGLSYLTDASFIEGDELEKMRGSDIIVINALRIEKHHSHFSLQEAIDILQSLAPTKGFLTHISHQMGFHAVIQKTLPENIFLAYDGLLETVGN